MSIRGFNARLNSASTVPKPQRVDSLQYSCSEDDLKGSLEKIHDLLREDMSIGTGCPFLLDFEGQKNYIHDVKLNMTVKQNNAFKKWQNVPTMGTVNWSSSVPFENEQDKMEFKKKLEAVRYLHSKPDITVEQAHAWINNNPQLNDCMGGAKAVVRAKRHKACGYKSHDANHTVEQLACSKLMKYFAKRHARQIPTTENIIAKIREIIKALEDRIRALAVV